jgi:short-subunit dehydrogenase involved in D-alanine esterification of teichoic acids
MWSQAASTANFRPIQLRPHFTFKLAPATATKERLLNNYGDKADDKQQENNTDDLKENHERVRLLVNMIGRMATEDVSFDGVL